MNEATFGFADWTPHPSVWIIFGTIGIFYWSWVRSERRSRSESDRPTSRKQIVSFYAGLAVLWIGSDFPIHDLAERFLFSMHMVQHTLFTLVAPPLLLMGTPVWMLRRVLQREWLMRVARIVTRPFVALVVFNAVIVITHWPTLVNLSVRSEAVHFVIHLVVFSTASMMWWPVISPLPELARLSEPGKMVYLFLQSVVPTVPASFLTFATTPIYAAYREFPRIWGIGVVNDLRFSGLIMKLGGGLLLWLAIAIIFFRWSAKEERNDHEEVTWEDFEHELNAFDMRRT